MNLDRSLHDCGNSIRIQEKIDGVKDCCESVTKIGTNVTHQRGSIKDGVIRNLHMKVNSLYQSMGIIAQTSKLSKVVIL